MTELLAALLGAVVGGLLPAGVGGWQTSKALKHETGPAPAERRETELVKEGRRKSVAADHLITALAEHITITVDTRDRAVHFVRMMVSADVRTSAPMQAGCQLRTPSQNKWPTGSSSNFRGKSRKRLSSHNPDGDKDP